MICSRSSFLRRLRGSNSINALTTGPEMRRSPRGLAVKGQDKNVNTVGAGTGNQPGRNIFVHPGNSSMREVSYGRIRLGGDQRQVSFANEGQETGLVCLQGECEVLAGGESFTLTRHDALYLPKGLPIKVHTASDAKLLQCVSSSGRYIPLQPLSGYDVRSVG